VRKSICLLLAAFSVGWASAQDWDCQTQECQGHKAGYDWGLNHAVTERDCDAAGAHYNSPSFAQGCTSAVIARRLFAEARTALAPLFQAYALGQQIAKESRALPSDCIGAYESMTDPSASGKIDTAEAIGFKNGCLAVANKQAKRIMKENEKQAKDAAKRATKQGQGVQ
jgi:hypothetical protein